MNTKASDYTDHLLIVEAPDNVFKNDRMPDEFADLLGAKTKLQILQSDSFLWREQRSLQHFLPSCGAQLL